MIPLHCSFRFHLSHTSWPVAATLSCQSATPVPGSLVPTRPDCHAAVRPCRGLSWINSTLKCLALSCDTINYSACTHAPTPFRHMYGIRLRFTTNYFRTRVCAKQVASFVWVTMDAWSVLTKCTVFNTFILFPDFDGSCCSIYFWHLHFA